jgi:uncharacterized integral membrane protein
VQAAALRRSPHLQFAAAAISPWGWNRPLESFMAIGYLVVAVLAAVVAVFALQNGAPATVRFLAWTLDGVPLAGLILGAFAAGLVIAGVPLGLQRWRARAQARRLEAHVRHLEARQVATPGAPPREAPPPPREAPPPSREAPPPRREAP